MRRVLVMSVIALGSVASVLADNAAYRHFDTDALEQGRAIWLATCEGCHGYGIAGAPVPMKPADWQARVARPRATLYDHAINGFFGPDDTMMPPRGGNDALTDTEVKSAVDYMVKLAESYMTVE